MPGYQIPVSTDTNQMVNTSQLYKSNVSCMIYPT